MPGKTPVLVMIQGHEPGARWKLRESRATSIGRSSRCDISLVHSSVSRKHCEIRYINGLWYVEDLDSKMGTALNGNRIEEREVLKPGDVIRISKNVFRFDLVEETAREDEALLAIREASMGTEIRRVGSEQDTLEAVRERQKLGLEEEAEKAPGEGFSFGSHMRRYGVITVAVPVVALAVVGLLLHANHRVGSVRAARRRLGADVEAALQRATAGAEEEGDYAAALDTLSQVVEGHPRAAEVERAAALYRRLEGEWVEKSMEEIRAAEAGGDFAAAWRRYQELREGLSSPGLVGMVSDLQEYTRRRAGAVYERIRSRAEQSLEAGEPQQAVALYREAAGGLGVPRLVREATERIQQIRQEGSAAPSDSGESSEPPEASDGAAQEKTGEEPDEAESAEAPSEREEEPDSEDALPPLEDLEIERPVPF